MADQTLHQEFSEFIEGFKVRQKAITRWVHPQLPFRGMSYDAIIWDEVDEYLPEHAREFLRDCNDEANKGRFK